MTGLSEQTERTEKSFLSEEEKIGGKRRPIHYIFFWAAGIATLFVWNCMLSLTGYLKTRIHPTVDDYYGFFFNFGGFIAFFLVDRVERIVSLRYLLMSVPCVLVTIFTGVYIMAETLEGGNPSYHKLYLFFAVITAAGFTNNLMQTTVIRHTFKFSYIEVSYYNSGSALAGILSNVIALVLAYVLDEKEVSKSGLVYLVFLIITLIIILFVFSKYFASGEAYNQVLQSVYDDGQAAPTFVETFKLMNSFFFHMLLLYSICLSIFPAFNFAMGMGSTHPAAAQYLLLTFNVGDFVGKFLYSKLALPDGILAHVLSIIRIGFTLFILYMFAGEPREGLLNQPAITLGFVALLSLSNGYLTSAYFSLSSSRVSPKHQSNSGFLMTVGLLLGLTYGSFTVLVGKTKAN